MVYVALVCTLFIDGTLCFKRETPHLSLHLWCYTLCICGVTLALCIDILEKMPSTHVLFCICLKFCTVLWTFCWDCAHFIQILSQCIIVWTIFIISEGSLPKNKGGNSIPRRKSNHVVVFNSLKSSVNQSFESYAFL